MNIFLFAQSKKAQNCPSSDTNAFDPGSTPDCVTNLPQVAANTDSLKQLLAVVFGVAAGIALLSLAIAALNFATAATDTDKISRSKKAIVFSLVGLIIALSAEAIVLTLIGKL